MARIEGKVNGGFYEIAQGGRVISQYPLHEAKSDSKLLAAIKRNSWEEIPEDLSDGN